MVWRWRKLMSNIIPKLNIPFFSFKFLLRILLLPIIVLFGLALLFGLTMVGILPIIVVLSIFGFIGEPLAYLIRLSGGKLQIFEPFLFDGPPMIGHLLGATIYFWSLPFFILDFILTGGIVGVEND
jgi:hypothetical protein